MSAKKPKESYYNVEKVFGRWMEKDTPINCGIETHREYGRNLGIASDLSDYDDRMEHVIRILLKKYDALDLAIAKYMYLHKKHIRTDLGWNTCPLCISQGWESSELSSRTCDGCAVKAKTNRDSCRESPHEKIELSKIGEGRPLDDQEFFDAMAEELEFLKEIWRERNEKPKRI